MWTLGRSQLDLQIANAEVWVARPLSRSERALGEYVRRRLAHGRTALRSQVSRGMLGALVAPLVK